LIYHNFKKAMKSNGVTQRIIAQTMGVREGTVSDWLTGKHAIRLDTAFEIRDKLFPNEDIEHLFARQ
jgi:transcriptional regulator with XRE-family HTH domain